MSDQAPPLQMTDLINVVEQAGVLKIMSERRCRQVTIDYCPPRESMAIPRDPGCTEPIEPAAPTVIPLTFLLEDTMFGGVIFVALTCGPRVVINPFVWVSYEHLGHISIERR